MRTTKQSFREAQTLAEFSNLRDEREAEYFRNNFPDFLPEELWYTPAITIDPGKPSESSPVWKLDQQALQSAWQEAFPDYRCIELITAMDKFSKASIALEEVARKLSHQGSLPEMRLPKTEVWPFQRAVMFLAVESWRARYCSGCGNRFVADKPSRRFCSDTCFQKSRKQAKLAWWREQGEDWRANRSKKGRK